MVRKAWLVGVLFLSLASACSPGSDDVTNRPGADTSGAGAGSGSSSGSDSGSGGFGLGTGGQSSGSGNTGNTTCASATEVSEVQEAPADIIWVVDQSGSMDQETQYVQQKINEFAELIEKSGIDYRVVMIADPDAGNAICVPPPLAGANCGDGPRFRLVPEQVGSNDGPEIALSSYPAYADFLRMEAAKHVIFVTDDNSDLSAAQFMQGLEALQPAGMFDNYFVHGIYAFGMGNDGCDGPFGSGAADGTVYTELIAATQGAAGVICTGDWTTVFQEITAAVLAGSKVPCVVDVPAPPPGETLDPQLVNVQYQSGMEAPSVIGQVGGESECGTGGWYYDDPVAPKQIHLCPETCDVVQADPEAKLLVELGCKTITAE